MICPTNAPAPVAEILPAESPAPATAAEKVVATLDKPVAAAPQVADVNVASRQPASLTKNDLIAKTFGALDPELTLTPTELTARKVRTVAIGADGLPVSAETAESPAPQDAPVTVAEAETPVVAEPVKAPVKAEPPKKVAEVPEEESPEASAYAPVRGGTATIGRQGANVRSLPKKGGSEVLFSLASGEEVTVTETSKGWSKVVDSRGRSGWIWGELLRR